MQKLAKAVLKVMEEVKGIEKSMDVGTGNYSYKGVPDQQVKIIIGEAMVRNGLCLLPIGIDAKTTIERWEEKTSYNGLPQVKSKQQVFVETTTKYMLIHESGESMEVMGYGHGVDTQDKAAGKSSTYALKYLLLYMFLVPTGKIDDSDNTHSEEIVVPVVKQEPIAPTKKTIPKERFDNALKSIEDKEYTAELLRETFELTEAQEIELTDLVKILKEEALKEAPTKVEKTKAEKVVKDEQPKK